MTISERRRIRTPWGSAILALALLLVALGAAGCEEDCEPCDDTARIYFEKSSPWASGTYDFAVQFDDELVNCSITLPFQPFEPVDRCDDSSTGVGGPVGTEIDGLFTRRRSPARIAVAISLDDELIADETFEPEYEDTPNWNRRCGPPCDHAVMMMSIP